MDFGATELKKKKIDPNLDLQFTIPQVTIFNIRRLFYNINSLYWVKKQLGLKDILGVLTGNDFQNPQYSANTI